MMEGILHRKLWLKQIKSWGVSSISKPRTAEKTNPSSDVGPHCSLTSFPHRSKRNIYSFSVDRGIYSLLPHHIKCLLK